MSDIGIILPAYNEEKNIKRAIGTAKKHLLNSFIVVVDDGSTDRTHSLAAAAGVKVLRHSSNKGKGEALRTAFNYFLKRKPGVKFVVVADADMQYDIADSKKIIRALRDGHADFVTGYRDFSKVPLRHRLGNFVWKTAFNLLFGTNFKDTNCGFIGVTRDAMKKLSGALRGGYIIENSMFIGAIKNNLMIRQVPVNVAYLRKSGVARGMRMVLGVFIFIIENGIRYRLKL